MRHKHADLIHAWANGADIQILSLNYGWKDNPQPQWLSDREYRIKPAKKPDVVRYTNVYRNGGIGNDYMTLDIAKDRSNESVCGHIRYTISGETGELITADVLK